MSTPSRRFARRLAALAVSGALAIGLAAGPAGVAATEAASQRYLVVFAGTYALDGTFALGGNYALNHEYALDIVRAAGGTVTNDLSKQIGVMVVDSSNEAFYALMSAYALVEEVGADWRWQGIPESPAVAADDPAEALQWDMAMIRTDEAQAVEAGRPDVEVGVLDTGIDGLHPDFQKGGTSNVDCARGRNSITFVTGGGPGVGIDAPCVDNHVHGTHVAGTIGARANGIGIVGVAPDVTLVPVKVCDSSGHCYASAVVDGITYAGDARLEVVNMSFFVDDDELLASTEFKCASDPTQRTFRKAVERAIQYARSQGVVPVAALGNSDQDLAHPVDENGEPINNECEVVPAETQGVVGTMSLGNQSQKASYSNYGTGAVDVAAPGGAGTTGDCRTTVLSTVPGGAYGCLQGTSMASPHAAGVAALIVSRFGSAGGDGDWTMAVTKVESLLQGSAVDIGLSGYDMCFGHGRIDALRAVTKSTTAAYDANAPFCPEYGE